MTLSAGMKLDGYTTVPQPSRHTAAILRRVARGYVLVTRHESAEGKKSESYAYDNGQQVWDERGNPLSTTAFRRMVREGWLIPIKGESLLGDERDAQRYRARQPKDGALPEIRNKRTGEMPMLPFVQWPVR